MAGIADFIARGHTNVRMSTNDCRHNGELSSSWFSTRVSQAGVESTTKWPYSLQLKMERILKKQEGASGSKMMARAANRFDR